MDRDGVDFLDTIPKILKDAGVYGPEKDNVNVVNFEHPLALEKILNLSLDHCSEGASDEELTELCKAVTKFSVKTGHRHFHNQLYAGVDNYALAGTWITEALNTSQYTFEVAPAFTLAEQTVLRRSARLFGFPEGGGDGIFCPGGSVSNMYAMVIARHSMFPQVKEDGVASIPPLAAFTSEDSHYSFQKASHWLGLGTKSLFKVRSDEMGRMIPEELKSALSAAKSQGLTPFFVNATAGTTVLGAFDPFGEIADICTNESIWMHVDACWGGSLLFSDKYKGVLKDINRADSISWNPHKMLGTPLQCSIFLVRHKDLMHNSNSAAAHYLFQQDKFYDVSYDTGDKSVQCGRKVDAFKLWLMWRARGDNGLRLLVDNAMSCAEYFKNKIECRPGFELINTNIQCTNICFWYIPPQMRGKERNEEWWERLHMVAPKMKEQMILSGTMMIGYTPMDHKGLKNFFRVVLSCHPPPSENAMDYIIDEIEKLGKIIEV